MKDWKGVVKSTRYRHRKTRAVVVVMKLVANTALDMPMQVHFFAEANTQHSYRLGLDEFIDLYKKAT